MPDACNVVPDRWLKEGNEVQLGQASFRILHCPGHTPGSVVFVNDKERFAVVAMCCSADRWAERIFREETAPR